MTMTDDKIATELRALFEDLGDAATVGASATNMRVAHDPEPAGRRPISLIALGVAAAGLLAVAGAVVVRDGRPDAQGSPPQNTSPTTSPAANAPMEQWPVTFRDLFDAALPDGFTALLANGSPLEAVAYNDQGVRMSVVVDLGNSEAVAKGIAPDQNSARTPEGDGVFGEVMYNFNDAMVPGGDQADAVQAARSLLPSVIAQVAANFTGDTRAAILGAAYPVIDSAELRDGISAALSPAWGVEIGNRIFGGADFALMYSNDASFITVTAIRSARSLTDGVTNPATTATTGLRWVNGWQIVVVSTPAASGQTPLDATLMGQILTTIEPLFASWQPGLTPEPGCATRSVQMGDSAGNVAERYAVTLGDLERANPDLYANFLGGATVIIPCTRTVTIPAGSPPPDAFLAVGASRAAWSFEATNGIIRSSALLTYTVSGGLNTETNEGNIRIVVTTFDGQPVREDLIILTRCPQPTELVNDLTAPLERIPFRCGPAGEIFTIDLYSGQSALTVGMTGESAPNGDTPAPTTTTTQA